MILEMIRYKVYSFSIKTEQAIKIAESATPTFLELLNRDCGLCNRSNQAASLSAGAARCKVNY